MKPQGVSVKIAKLPRSVWGRFLAARPDGMPLKGAVTWILSPDEPEPCPELPKTPAEWGREMAAWRAAWVQKLAAGIQAGRAKTYEQEDTRTATKPSTHIPAEHAEAVKDACGQVLGVTGIGFAIAHILCGIDPDFEAALKPREEEDG
jgi:hypothetical protein